MHPGCADPLLKYRGHYEVRTWSQRQWSGPLLDDDVRAVGPDLRSHGRRGHFLAGRSFSFEGIHSTTKFSIKKGGLQENDRTAYSILVPADLLCGDLAVVAKTDDVPARGEAAATRALGWPK